jgi:hypothetical protein
MRITTAIVSFFPPMWSITGSIYKRDLAQPHPTSLPNHNTKCLVRPHHRAAGQGNVGGEGLNSWTSDHTQHSIAAVQDV